MMHSIDFDFYSDIAKQLRSIGTKQAQLCQDSRKIREGDIFVAFSGDTHDGRHHIEAAFQLGACMVLAEASGLEKFLTPNIKAHQVIAVDNLKHALGHIASAFYAYPSQSLEVIGVTGTNGKTTVVNYLAPLLEQLQQKPCAILGTLGAGLYGHAKPTGLTTPHASQVHSVLATAVSAGAGSAAIEATSIGLQEGRLNGVAIDIAAFTNFTQDHLDYHGTLSAYAAAKRALFDWSSLHTAVININDELGLELFTHLQTTRPALRIISTGVNNLAADLNASDIKVLSNGTQSCTLHYQNQCYTLLVPVLGAFNIDNILTVLGCLLALNYDLTQIIPLLPHLNHTVGRMEVVKTTQPQTPLVLVDYAHTPDGLLKALQALRPVAQARGGKLHIIFGCGGNRDTSKRPLMGAIAQTHADYVCITTDNPRDESPEAIAAQIAVAAPNASIQLDRYQAIQQVIQSANINDVVLIAGKGHETTQIIKGHSIPFSDVLSAQNILNNIHIK
jgi:UDP-N-acetylmuramyl-tripeptide synthetase